MRELNEIAEDAERILAVCRAHTVRLSEKRLELPAAPPHMIEPNFSTVNAPGSTLFIPIADASEQVLSLMAMFTANGLCDRRRPGKAAGWQAAAVHQIRRWRRTRSFRSQ